MHKELLVQILLLRHRIVYIKFEELKQISTETLAKNTLNHKEKESEWNKRVGELHELAQFLSDHMYTKIEKVEPIIKYEVIGPDSTLTSLNSDDPEVRPKTQREQLLPTKSIRKVKYETSASQDSDEKVRKDETPSEDISQSNDPEIETNDQNVEFTEEPLSESLSSGDPFESPKPKRSDSSGYEID